MNALSTTWQFLAENLLGILVVQPALAAIICWMLSSRNDRTARQVAAISAGLTILISAALLAFGGVAIEDSTSVATTWGIGSDTANGGPFGVSIGLQLNGLNTWLVAISALVGWAAVWVAPVGRRTAMRMDYPLLLLIQATSLATFLAADVITFCVCAEITALLAFIMLGACGGYERQAATSKMILFQLVGGGLTVLGMAGLVLAHAWMSTNADQPHPPLVFSIPQLVNEIPALMESGSIEQKYWVQSQNWIFAALLIGLTIKIALVPFHTWFLPAIVAAPASLSLLMAVVLTKIGVYGVLRFLVPLFPGQIAPSVEWLLPALVVSSLYAGLLAIAQGDMKKMVVCASIGHHGFSLAGILSSTALGVSGGMLVLTGQSLTTATLLVLVAAIEQHFETSEIETFGGLMHRYRRTAALMLIAIAAGIGFPGTAQFIGGLLTTVGLFQGRSTFLGFPLHPLIAVGSLLAVLLVIWAYIAVVQRCLFGKPREPVLPAIPVAGFPNRTDAGESNNEAANNDIISARETTAILPMLVAVVVIGLVPQLFLNQVQPILPQVVPGDVSEVAGEFSMPLSDGSTSLPAHSLQKTSHASLPAK